MLMATDDELTPTDSKRKPWHFQPGHDSRRDNSGRKRVTPEQRKLQALTRAQVQQALEEMIGPALRRLEAIVKKGEDDATAAKAIFTLLDRVIGPVPSASYIAAQLSNANGNPGGVGCVEFTEQDALVAMANYIQQHGDGRQAVTIDMPKD